MNSEKAPFRLTTAEVNKTFADATLAAYSLLTGLKAASPLEADFMLMNLAKAVVLLDLGISATHDEVDRTAKALYLPASVDTVIELRKKMEGRTRSSF